MRRALPVQFSVCVLAERDMGTLDTCMESLEPTLAGHDVELLVVNGGADVQTQHLVAQLPYILRVPQIDVDYEQHERLAGYAKLLEMAEGQIVVLASDQSVFQDVRWLDRLEAELRDPSTMAAGPQGWVIYPDMSVTPALARECDMLTGLAAFTRNAIDAGLAAFTFAGEPVADATLQLKAGGLQVACTGNIGVYLPPYDVNRTAWWSALCERWR